MNKNDESERNGFVWPVILKNPNAHANVDFYYGPYDSLDSLKEGVPNDLWVPGFTAAVQDDDGVVTEWWVQGEGASARWEQKGVRHDTYVAIKGVRNSLAELEAIENPEVGDMYFVPEEGETGSFLEYVYTVDKWELLGRNSGKTRGVLTMIESDGTKKFNGCIDVVVDLSKYVKKDELFKQDLNVMYMNLKSGSSYYYDADGVMQYSGLTIYRYLDGFTFGDGTNKALHIGLGGHYNRISITAKGIYFNLNYGAIWRLNPLVLAVQITEAGTISKILFDPYNLSVNMSLEIKNGLFDLTHNLVNSGITNNEATYSVTSYTQLAAINTSTYINVVSKNKNNIQFQLSTKYVGDIPDFVPAVNVDLFFYDFSFFI